MAGKTYWEKLKDPRWQKKRLEVLQERNFECEDCGSKEKTLHVHHRLYKKGAAPWEYENRQLACLCEDCHRKEHDFDTLFKEAWAISDMSARDTALGLLHGYLLISGEIGSVQIIGYEHLEGISFAYALNTNTVREHVRSGGVLHGEDLLGVLD